MSEYPIEGLMNTAMNSIKEMIDVNTIIGEPIETSNNIVVIPVSKVNFGFVAGGSEFTGKIEKRITSKNEKVESKPAEKIRLPFGGGSGAGVSISPIAFIVVQSTGVKLLPVEHSSSLDKLIDLIPDFVDRINQIIDRQAKKIEKKNGLDFKFNYNNNNKSNDNEEKNKKQNNKEFDYEYDETSDM